MKKAALSQILARKNTEIEELRDQLGECQATVHQMSDDVNPLLARLDVARADIGWLIETGVFTHGNPDIAHRIDQLWERYNLGAKEKPDDGL